jgi:hypothetical protein
VGLTSKILKAAAKKAVEKATQDKSFAAGMEGMLHYPSNRDQNGKKIPRHLRNW